MTKVARFLYGVPLAAVLCMPTLRAQGTDAAKPEPSVQPVAPYQPPLPAGSTSILAVNPSSDIPVAGDDRPLSGLQGQMLGPNLGPRNVLVPSFTVVSQLATGSSASGLSEPALFNYLLATLDLNHATDRADLLLHYTGGGMLSSYLNATVQELEFTYSYKWQRWSLLLGDDASYLSESPFGFGGVGGLDLLTGDSPFGPGGPLSSILGPNQTIPTILVPRLSNTAVSQVEYNISPRSSWTASGSYGTLDFLGVDYINSAETLFQTGYNYSLSPRSSIAVIYRFDDFRFTQFSQSIVNQVMQFAYERNVTGRLNWHVAAGPSLVMLRGVLTGYGNKVSWAVDGALSYKMDRSTLQLSYAHLVTGGSGVLFGAQTGQVQATLERALSPRWQGSASLGYATNGSLIPAAASSARENYNSWYATVRLNHQFRPGTAFFVSYQAQLEALSPGACTTPTCGTSSISHEFSVGFNFSLRPISLR
jgi:hypothetical protein